MKLTLSIKFYEPYCGALMIGERELWVKDEKDVKYTLGRYFNYFQEMYGDSAEITLLKLEN